MKILTLLGSPRANSNSAAIAARFSETAATLGAQVETVALNPLACRGCQGCYACKTKADRCVVQDDLTPILARVESADILVLATPVYFGDVTAQLKTFLDRCYSFLAPGYLTGGEKGRFRDKKLLFIQTQGSPDPASFDGVFPRISHFMEWIGFGERRLIRACGLAPSRVEALPETVLAEAEEAARSLCL